MNGAFYSELFLEKSGQIRIFKKFFFTTTMVIISLLEYRIRKENGDGAQTLQNTVY